MGDATLLAHEDERFRAMIAGDLATLDRLIADDLRFVHSNGAVEGKAEFLRKLRSGERRYRRYEALSREVRQEGALGLVFGEAEAEIERPGGSVRARMIYTAVYRGGAEPRLLAWHSVKSPAPAEGP